MKTILPTPAPALIFIFGIIAACAGARVAPAQAWKAAGGPLSTPWTKDVSADRALPEHPRPQLERREWLNLNGLWDHAVRPRDAQKPASFDGPILVPFPIESALSGVMKRVSEEERLWYRRSFEVPAGWNGKRVLLHFGAVDFEATVWVNGTEVGRHRGGYDPFTIDVTAALKPKVPQELVVSAWDPADASPYPRGKQVRMPRGIFYTPTTGIWQTVWLEPVPQAYIESLRIEPDLRLGAVRITVNARGGDASLVASVSVSGPDGKTVATGTGKAGDPIPVPVPGAALWTPETPGLYSLEVRLGDGGPAGDSVRSYFGFREVSIGPDEKGVTRILLNGKPYFMLGPLDQGFWPDGLYTAPTDEALRHDVEITKRMGFNCARKHVKVEPDRWYYWCDKLGLIVWQDMPSGDRSIGGGDPDITRSEDSAKEFEAELKAMIDALRNHPSIVMWVVFNEGWGQYDTKRVVEWTKRYDPTRLANNASGWTDRGAGDVIDMHAYPGPGSPRPEAARAAVLGEFGGLGLPLEGHTWVASRDNWGYVRYRDAAELSAAYERLMQRLAAFRQSSGLSAAIYTQTTDVETEVNGLLTYDRAVVKMGLERTLAANRKAFLPAPEVKVVVPASQESGIEWRYTTQAPKAGWEKEGFDDATWQSGPGGFGARGTPGAVVRTDWRTPQIWLRRTFDLAGPVPGGLELLIHHDEDAEVYFNGVLALRVPGFTSDYELLPISKEAAAALRQGKNLIAVNCIQTRGGQYIDVGMAQVIEAAR